MEDLIMQYLKENEENKVLIEISAHISAIILTLIENNITTLEEIKTKIELGKKEIINEQYKKIIKEKTYEE